MPELQNQPFKLYSQRSITIATYFGGPVAAGILVRKNYLQLGKEKEAMVALVTGIILTFLLLAAILSISEPIMDKIPNALIPLIYTALIALVVEKLQGKDIKAHNANQGEFYSAWKAAGVGAYCMAILVVCIFSFIYLSPDNFDSKKYDTELATMGKEEQKALELFKSIDRSHPQKSVEFIDQIGLPAWKSSIEILNRMDQMEGIDPVLVKQDEVLRNYCNLRIESFQLIRKALLDTINNYDSEIQKYNEEMEKELAKLKQ